jgi:hypothetical protein
LGLEIKKIMDRILRKNFNDYEIVNENYSQASQDLFVLSCTNGKKNGTFLDLGCSHPTNINNTFLLENKFGWTGVSIDIENSLVEKYNGLRECVALNMDCTKLDFNEILGYYSNNHIDYLSLDLEPAEVTLECLKKIPFNNIEFSVITYEHDEYRFGDYYKNESRKIFEKNGYILLCSNVSDNEFIYEDWYVNPNYISLEIIEMFKCENKSWDKIVFLN